LGRPPPGGRPLSFLAGLRSNEANGALRRSSNAARLLIAGGTLNNVTVAPLGDAKTERVLFAGR
jgi:hypothetical protein